MKQVQWSIQDSQQIETVLTVSPKGTVTCVEVNPRETYVVLDTLKGQAFLDGEGQSEVTRRFGREVLNAAVRAVEERVRH